MARRPLALGTTSSMSKNKLDLFFPTFRFFDLHPIRRKIIDIASLVHCLHTVNRRRMMTKKQIHCKDRPKLIIPSNKTLLLASHTQKIHPKIHSARGTYSTFGPIYLPHPKPGECGM